MLSINPTSVLCWLTLATLVAPSVSAQDAPATAIDLPRWHELELPAPIDASSSFLGVGLSSTLDRFGERGQIGQAYPNDFETTNPNLQKTSYFEFNTKLNFELGASCYLGSAELQADAHLRYVVYNAYCIKKVERLKIPEDPVNLPGGCVWVPYQILYGWSASVIVFGAGAGFSAELKTTLATASGEIKGSVEANNLQARTVLRGLHSKNDSVVIVRTEKDVSDNYTIDAKPVPIFVKYRLVSTLQTEPITVWRTGRDTPESSAAMFLKSLSTHERNIDRAVECFATKSRFVRAFGDNLGDFLEGLTYRRFYIHMKGGGTERHTRNGIETAQISFLSEATFNPRWERAESEWFLRGVPRFLRLGGEAPLSGEPEPLPAGSGAAAASRIDAVLSAKHHTMDLLKVGDEWYVYEIDGWTLCENPTPTIVIGPSNWEVLGFQEARLYNAGWLWYDGGGVTVGAVKKGTPLADCLESRLKADSSRIIAVNGVKLIKDVNGADQMGQLASAINLLNLFPGDKVKLTVVFDNGSDNDGAEDVIVEAR